MAKVYPSFITRDLGAGPEGDAEMLRRWKVYNSEMQALIASGGVHQDSDGWWVDDATGALIGPDPEIERPRTDAELAEMRPLREAMPEFHAAVMEDIRKRGPVRTKTPVSIRLDDDVLQRLRATGVGWQTRANDALRAFVEREVEG